MTLLAISFHATRINVIRSRWQAEKRNERHDVFSQQTIGMRGTEQYAGGTFIVFDWEKNQVVWHIDIDAVAGFCWHEGLLFLNRIRSGEIVAVDGYGHEIRRISHPGLNDLHTIVATSRGFLLTSSGTDSIIELDQQGHLLYEWCALDHGYRYLPNNQERILDRSLDQRYMIYPTPGHTTHVNSARFADPGEEVILATLFHQGTVVTIDRESGNACTVVDNLKLPHDIRPFAEEGWILSDSGHNRTLILNKNWEIVRLIDMDFDWVQSSAPLSDGSIVIADTNHHCLIRVYPGERRPPEVRAFPTEWRIFLIEEVPQEANNFFHYPIATPFL
jgi:hypothetical protein